MYPRSAASGDASAASASTSDRREARARSSTEPTTRYEDGPLDALAIALFNSKLLAAVETARDGRGAPLTAEEKNALPRAGFDRLVALADGIGSSGRSPAAQRAVVLETLLSIRRAGADMIFTYYARPAARWRGVGAGCTGMDLYGRGAVTCVGQDPCGPAVICGGERQ